MASAARELRYRTPQSISGNLAHDLDWAVRERELRHAGEIPRHQELVQPKPKVKTLEHVRVRERQRVSVFSLLGISSVLGLAVLVLMSYIQLTVLSAQTVELKSELAALENIGGIRLLYCYPDAIDDELIGLFAEERLSRSSG